MKTQNINKLYTMIVSTAKYVLLSKIKEYRNEKLLLKIETNKGDSKDYSLVDQRIKKNSTQIFLNGIYHHKCQFTMENLFKEHGNVLKLLKRLTFKYTQFLYSSFRN